MYNTIHREGFEDLQDQHLTSKNKQKLRQTQLYFQIPEAKPLLSKISIDRKKPKILIRDVKMYLEYPQLLNAPVDESFHDQQKLAKKQSKYSHTTLWQKYLLSNNYKCLYIKFIDQKLQENERKGKKLKAILQKISIGNQWLLPTYILQMSFLSETTSISLRNLQTAKIKEDLQALKDEQVVFDSRFQNGNLMYVFQKLQSSSREFDLMLQNDINTKGYANWFYFKVHSVRPGPLKLNIVNLQKNFSYFGQGMKVAVFSIREKKGWRMQGSNISYFKNQILKCQQNKERYNTLSFTIQQSHPNDILIFATSPPYTYSRLLNFLQHLQKQIKLKPNLYFRREPLCNTISSNQCQLITLTSKRDRKEDKTKKKIIIIIARQHPSEVVSSWIAEGLIQGLISENAQFEELLRKYIFKIVPMVNIDGVIYGNSRCDISGSDCNRKWTKNSNQVLYPTVSAIRKLVTELIQQGYQVQYFFDLHGHSRKLGSFIYGCKSFDQIQSRIFAWLLSKITDKFSFQECRFGVSPFRKETARGFMGGMLTNKKSMTIQTSFYGYKNNLGELLPFTPEKLKSLGENLLTAIHWDTFRTNNIYINWSNVRNQIRMSMKNTTKEDSSEGSDSDPEGQELNQKQKATFLSPSLATKIGLVQVNVIQKPHNNLKISSQQKNFNFKHPTIKEEIKPISSIKRLTISQSLARNEFIYSKVLGESKSVTKIDSFRVRSLDKKEKKKIRIAIQLQKEPKNPATMLLQVKNRNSIEFWKQLKYEYQTLISQKKDLLQYAKSQQLDKN